MRTIHFPIETEKPEILEYLLNTYLLQNGSIRFSAGVGDIEVGMLETPDSRWETTYIITLCFKPENMKYSRAKYLGYVTNDLKEVKSIVLSFQQKQETKAKRYKKITGETIIARPVCEEE